MSDIFLSYAREDADRARRVAGAFEAQGWAVWWDHTIPPGSTWAEVIEREIESARCVVVLWSAASVPSKWVNKEARKGDGLGILVPVLFDDAVVPPFEFEHIQAARLSDWSGDPSHPQLLLLLREVQAKLGEGRKEPAVPIVVPGRTPALLRRRAALALGAGLVGLAAMVVLLRSAWLDAPPSDEAVPEASAPEGGDTPPERAEPGPVRPPRRNTTITPTRLGDARLCQTAGQLRQALPRDWGFGAYEGQGGLVETEGVTVTNAAGEVEFFALALQGEGPGLHLFVTENPAYRTSEGVGPGTPIQEATLHYGSAKLAYHTESESREFVTFPYGPQQILFRTGLGPHGFAGIYEGSSDGYYETDQFRPDAVIEQVWIDCRGCPCGPPA